MAVRRSLMIVLAFTAAACGGGGYSSESSAIVATLPATEPLVTSTSSTTSTTTTTTSTTSTTTTTTTTVRATTTTTVPTTVGSILVAGDSNARSLFPPVQAALETDSTEVRLQWVIGVLLDDGMVKWERIFTIDRPEVVVAHFMAWESAALREGTVIDTSAPDWAASYRAEWVEPWIELAVSTGSMIIWVTPPLTADPDRSAEHQEVGGVWVEAIEQHNAVLPTGDQRRISVIDSVALSAGPDGEFVDIDWTVDPAERLFNADGLHWCPAGAARVTDGVIDTLISAGIATPSTRTPDWQTSSWALDPASVRASEPNFGPGYPYPPGECPDPAKP